MSDLAAIVKRHPFVLDTETGGDVTLDLFLGDADYGTVVGDLRMRLEMEGLDGRPRFVCPIKECGDSMTLKRVEVRSKADKHPHRFYFKHRFNENKCRGTGHLPPSMISAMKFNGAKESRQHLEFKQRIVESIEADPSFSECMVEKRWVDADGGQWRQPDVQATRGDRHVAFEVQLSTTFLHVIAQRMKFYRDNHGVLIWLFRNLDFSKFLQAEDDIFYSNNWNAFRVTDETVALSKAEGRFALECAWKAPVIHGPALEWEQRTQTIFFDQLKFDVGKNQVPRAYFHNCEVDRAWAKAVEPTLPWVHRFEKFWLRQELDLDEWACLRDAMRTMGVDMPEHTYDDGNFRPLLNVLYSVKHGRMIGYDYKTDPFVRLGHHLFDQKKPFLRVFHLALNAFDRAAEVKRQDRNEKFSAKAHDYLRLIAKHDPEFELGAGLSSVVAFLFPEIDRKRIR